MEQLKDRHENPNGLYAKYAIYKLKPTGSEDFFLQPEYEEVPVDEDAEYFILRLDEGGKDINHIKACRIGIHAYANAIEATIPKLATDLRKRYPLLP